MKTRIEIKEIDGVKWYSPQSKVGKEFKYITEHNIGVFTLSNSPTKFNWINGAEKLIDRYLFQKNQKASKINKCCYIKYP